MPELQVLLLIKKIFLFQCDPRCPSLWTGKMLRRSVSRTPGDREFSDFMMPPTHKVVVSHPKNIVRLSLTMKIRERGRTPQREEKPLRSEASPSVWSPGPSPRRPDYVGLAALAPHAQLGNTIHALNADYQGGQLRRHPGQDCPGGPGSKGLGHKRKVAQEKRLGNFSKELKKEEVKSRKLSAKVNRLRVFEEESSHLYTSFEQTLYKAGRIPSNNGSANLKVKLDFWGKQAINNLNLNFDAAFNNLFTIGGADCFSGILTNGSRSNGPPKSTSMVHRSRLYKSGCGN
ncbi:hypothetical protein DM860_002237 [Cuscuta australis]|uniref:Uncharacterized protein n=1 Tax=Cuscuta australis TaxID=267555 RepID=A0A328DXD4_9ASTE|nr:hypothetical protein DM860_002237 [Cuscuta australis]